MTDRAQVPVAQRFGKLKAILPYLVAALLFGLGMAALYRLLEPVKIDDVVMQLRAMPWTTLAAALLTTICAYLSLVGYDWSALRHIGKPLPLPVVLTGGLMAYAFGNTIGLSAISGGAVRWRVYSGLGLDGYDVAAVSTFTAVSFGVAATVVGLSALALHPGALAAVLPFSPGMVQLAALAGIAAILLPLIWASVGRRAIRIGRFHLATPSLPILAGQFVFSMGDLGFTALTLWLLLPVTGMDFLPFLAVFAAASVAAVVSHVPGGIGIFETVIIAAMPAGTPIGPLAAALLLYRLMYYLLPFALALIVLAGYELWRSTDHRRPDGPVARSVSLMEPALRAVMPLAPLVLGVMIFGAGLWMSLATLIPPTGPAAEAAEAAEAVLPRMFAEGSALLTSAIGAVLIVLALGVVRRSFGAFVVAAAAIAAGAGMALADGDTRRALGLALALAILLPFRRAFFRRATLTEAAMGPGWIVLVLSTLTAFGFVLFFANKSTTFSHEMWWQFATDERAPRALRAGFTASLTVVTLALILLLRAPRFRPGPPDDRAMSWADAVIRRSPDPTAGFALTRDKALIFSQSGDGFVMFAPSGRSWIALGGAVGEPDAQREAAWRFVEAARQEGAQPVFYEVAPEDLPLMLELGMSLHNMGEEAVVDLAGFSLDGPARAQLRAAHARALHDGLSLTLAMPPHDPALIADLRVISDAWLAGNRRREKRFSVGRFDPGWLDRWPLAVVRHHGQPVAFASLLTAPETRRATVDLMRLAAPAPDATMDFLLTEMMLQLRAGGWTSLSLGMAPLSGLDPARSRRLWDRFGALIFRHGGNFDDFAGLRAFKQKFDPDWRPRYLAVPTSLPPLRPLVDAATLIGGESLRVLRRPWRMPQGRLTAPPSDTV